MSVSEENIKIAEKIVSIFTDFVLPDIGRTRDSENDFLKDLTDASNIVRKILLTTCLIQNTTLEGEKSDILLGNLVRIFKLYDTYIFLIVEKKAEMAFILLRCLTENLINFEYLVKYIDTDIFEKYKKASLLHEVNLKNWINDDINSGIASKELPILKRIFKSIEETFNRSGIAEEEEDFYSRWGIKKEHFTLEGKAKDLGFERIYKFIFKNMSGSVHGDWHDIDFNHLEREKTEFNQRIPKTNFCLPTPQMFTISILVLEAIKKYWKLLGFSDFDDKINKIVEWFKSIDQKHEIYLQSLDTN